MCVFVVEDMRSSDIYIVEKRVKFVQFLFLFTISFLFASLLACRQCIGAMWAIGTEVSLCRLFWLSGCDDHEPYKNG